MMMSKSRDDYLPLTGYEELPAEAMLARAQSFLELMKTRRSVRSFSRRPVDRKVIELCIQAAGRAPSGANQQPWKFVVVSDAELKRQIRQAAEVEERAFYEERASDQWLEVLRPLGTDAEKPFLEDAPYLIVVFCENYRLDENGKKIKHYYVRDSVGIAIGMLITALHNAGLACLTHTPSPMQFLREILGRPDNETALMILVAGYPKKGVMVPDLDKKTLDEIALFL